MIPQVMHPMFPRPIHDEEARQDFVNDFRAHLASRVVPGHAQTYAKRALPAFVKQNKREPKDRHEVRRVMTQDSYYQLWSAMQRNSQEMIWDSVIDSVERQLPDLMQRAGDIKGKGSLTLNPALQIPRYHAAADIHLQPGAYHADFGANDVSAGAVYDRGTFIYSMGGLGEHNDGLGRILHKFFRKTWPDRRIQRVLDMGCTVGGSVTFWSQQEPGVEFYAIDIGAACLRYGHARAKAVGGAVHFSQQNAEKTNFADASFDLVTSHIMLHETSRTAIQNIMTESHRLLKPGGLMLHLDLPQAAGHSPLDAFLYDWEIYNNNEHFYGLMRDLDFPEICAKAGFDRAKYKHYQVSSGWDDGQTPYSDGDFMFSVYTAEK